MNNLFLLGIAVVILVVIMNGSRGKSVYKSVRKGISGNGKLVLLVVGGFILYRYMNPDLVEGIESVSYLIDMEAEDVAAIMGVPANEGDLCNPNDETCNLLDNALKSICELPGTSVSSCDSHPDATDCTGQEKKDGCAKQASVCQSLLNSVELYNGLPDKGQLYADRPSYVPRIFSDGWEQMKTAVLPRVHDEKGKDMDPNKLTIRGMCAKTFKDFTPNPHLP
jgi:hypothetical protein